MPTRRIRLLAGVVLGLALPLATAVAAVSPGPPFPDPVVNQAVYDQAGVFKPATIATLERAIDAIEARSGAEVVVYTQVWPSKIDQARSEANARALIDQWGIGRRGFDDSLVIMFDLDPSLVHGQVSLFAGSGFRSTFLSDSDRQRIFDDDMLPRLKAGDLDGAALIAIQRVDAATTPENAGRLELARQLNAVLGILGGGAVLFGLGGWTLFHWLRFGRDPVYLDSASVLVPAPPDGMTAATATVVFDDEATRRTLTTAMLDLASRGLLAFTEVEGLFGLGKSRLSIDVGSRARRMAEDDLADGSVDAAPAGNDTRATREDRQRHLDEATARLSLAARRPLSGAETYLRRELESLASDESLQPDDVLKLAAKVPAFNEQMEDNAVRQGWFKDRPSRVVRRWRIYGGIEAVGGGGLIWAGTSIPISGLTLVGAAAIAVGIFTFILAAAMPARTMSGAMQRAWLFAYRRTLERTMEQARSMDQVVKESGLEWLETPDQAVVWSVALGLSNQVQHVLSRTLDDARQSGSGIGYLPIWYRGPGGTSFGAVASGGGGGGLFSSSGLPDLGGMFSALGTIGNPPSSSGGGGGFGGGGGGGGGGAGGGF
ncbi:MAG: TPM domain-containing protein [Chloroflexi bacterium]|nr:TPM domain-containing protein [Chloroflexota bacterium]